MGATDRATISETGPRNDIEQAYCHRVYTGHLDAAIADLWAGGWRVVRFVPLDGAGEYVGILAERPPQG